MIRKLCACCAAVGVLFTAACGPEVRAGDRPEGAVPAEPAPPPTGTAVLPAQPIEHHTDAVPAAAEFAAVVFSDLDADVAARSSGVIRAVEVDLGDAVRAGHVLARLDDARQLARVESAAAARDLNRAEFERVDGLLQRGFVTQAQHDAARYGLRAAEAALREAEVELEHMRVVAPFDGVVTRRSTGAGRTAEEGEPLFRVTALAPLRALCRVPEAAAARIARGTRAVIATESGARVDAIVSRISPAVDPASGTVDVLLDIPRPGPLRPGTGAIVRFATGS